MKIQRIQSNNVPAKKRMARKNLTPSLSNDAFYLIALAVLLKEESGKSSLTHYIVPGSKPVMNDKTAA